MIKRLNEPADTVTRDWYVHCKRPTLPAKVNDVVEEVVRYATLPVGAYRTNPCSGDREYLIEIETTDGFMSKPQFYTVEKLRQAISNILYPYHRIDTS